MVSPPVRRTPVAVPLRTTIDSTSAPVRQVPPWSSISRTSASASFAPPPRGIGIPPSCTATPITWVMKPAEAASGPSPVWSTQGASSPWARSDVNVAWSQSRLDTSMLPVNSTSPRRPKRRRLRPERGARSRPELGAEHAEREIGVREELVEHPLPGGAVAVVVAIELRAVRVGRAEQKRRLAVREERRGRVVRVQILEPARGEVVAELGVRRAADPERVPGAEDVVVEARLGDLGRLDRAAEPVVALEHADAPAGPREQRAARERVDPAADDDGVVLGHSHQRAP